ncbi:MAG: UDP-N-acetylmuramoyl-L-alanyl-D-glutamate--2,6-diaminopimelate ligase [Chloroflexota bacterium]
MSGGRPGGISARLAAAEPPAPRPLAHLVARLDAAGLLVRTQTVAGEGLSGTVRGPAYDSREVGPGSVFVAVPGAHVDGHDFAGRAVAGGAVAVIVERPIEGLQGPQLIVRSSQRALAAAATWWYGDPSRDLAVIGITGTDGKTTTSLLAVAALEAAGVPAGLVGTVETKIGGDRESNVAHATTPEAPLLQAAIRAMVQAGDRAALIETTSHGLALGRVDGIAYDAAVLTNLTHEHLEFHGTWEAYRNAKVSLFERLAVGAVNPAKRFLEWPRSAIINVDDPSADRFIAVAQGAGARIIGFGAAAGADVRLGSVDEAAGGLVISTHGATGSARLRLRLAGRFNAHNALAVIALGEAMGLDAAAVRAGLESVKRIPGRMESVDAGQPFAVVVDYAHSPASLRTVLDQLGPAAEERGGGVIAVFGSAGERDVAKRPMMGRLAGERCRLVIVTDEDPRGEDRHAILDEIAVGAEQAGRRRGDDLLLIADRRGAIRAAFERARPGDVVLLAGKGHESSILYDDGPLAWDERAVALEILAEHGFRGSDRAGRT